MPTYDYRCKDCGHDFEVVQSFSDDALTTCERCGGALRKVFGSVGIAFKGSGFYKNDSRGKSSSAAPPAASESSSSGSDSTSTSSSTDSSTKSDTKKTEAKPAKKADATPKSS